VPVGMIVERLARTDSFMEPVRIINDLLELYQTILVIIRRKVLVAKGYA
jgi:hypothetical protein